MYSSQPKPGDSTQNARLGAMKDGAGGTGLGLLLKFCGSVGVRLGKMEGSLPAVTGERDGTSPNVLSRGAAAGEALMNAEGVENVSR